MQNTFFKSQQAQIQFKTTVYRSIALKIKKNEISIEDRKVVTKVLKMFQKLQTKKF